jgi:AcrR family transcriptional regulator
MHGSPPADAEPERFEPDAIAALPDELALSRLPAGRHNLPRSFVDRNQRLRIIAAMLRVLPSRGYHHMTIGHVTREASVSRSTFYGQFESKEECFLATYDLAAAWLCGRVEAAAAGDEQWPDRVRAGVSEAMRLLAANPDIAHLIAVEATQAGLVARRRQQACITRLATALRADRPSKLAPPDDLEELLVGGTLSLIARYVDAGHVEQLPDATGNLVALYFLK